MGKKSGYLEREKAKIGVYRQAEKETYIQFMSDMFQIALNDPEVMGKDVLGEARIKKVVEAASANYDLYHRALEKTCRGRVHARQARRKVEKDFQREAGPVQPEIPVG